MNLGGILLQVGFRLIKNLNLLLGFTTWKGILRLSKYTHAREAIIHTINQEIFEKAIECLK